MREGRGWRIAGRDRIRKQECRSEEEEVYLTRGRYSVHVSKKICVFPRDFSCRYGERSKAAREDGRQRGKRMNGIGLIQRCWAQGQS